MEETKYCRDCVGFTNTSDMSASGYYRPARSCPEPWCSFSSEDIVDRGPTRTCRDMRDDVGHARCGFTAVLFMSRADFAARRNAQEAVKP